MCRSGYNVGICGRVIISPRCACKLSLSSVNHAELLLIDANVNFLGQIEAAAGIGRLNISLPAAATSPYTINPFEIPSGIEIIVSLVDSMGFPNTRMSRRLVTLPGSESCLTDGPGRSNDIEVGVSTASFTTCQDFVAAWPDAYLDTPTSVLGMIPSGDIWEMARTTGGAYSAQVKMRNRPDRKAIVSVWGKSGGGHTG